MKSVKEIEELLSVIEDLCTFPVFRRIIEHRVFELKSLLSRNFNQYKELIRYDNPNLFNDENINNNEFVFELFLVGKKTWIPNIFNLPCNIDPFSVISTDIISFIVNYKIDCFSSQIVMLHDLTFHSFEGQKIDLSFKKINDHLFTGIIKIPFIKNVLINKPDIETNFDFDRLKIFVDFCINNPGFFDLISKLSEKLLFKIFSEKN